MAYFWDMKEQKDERWTLSKFFTCYSFFKNEIQIFLYLVEKGLMPPIQWTASLEIGLYFKVLK
jgi:hypothetical protein